MRTGMFAGSKILKTALEGRSLGTISALPHRFDLRSAMYTVPPTGGTNFSNMSASARPRHKPGLSFTQLPVVKTKAQSGADAIALHCQMDARILHRTHDQCSYVDTRTRSTWIGRARPGSVPAGPVARLNAFVHFFEFGLRERHDVLEAPFVWRDADQVLPQAARSRGETPLQRRWPFGC